MKRRQFLGTTAGVCGIALLPLGGSPSEKVYQESIVISAEKYMKREMPLRMLNSFRVPDVVWWRIEHAEVTREGHLVGKLTSSVNSTPQPFCLTGDWSVREIRHYWNVNGKLTDVYSTKCGVENFHHTEEIEITKANYLKA